MATDVIKMVQSVLAEKTAIAAREKELIDNLNRVLPDMGYRVVPMGSTGRRSSRPSGTVREADKTLSCPHCPRRFAHPLHLGRHVGAMHREKKRRRKAS